MKIVKKYIAYGLAVFSATILLGGAYISAIAKGHVKEIENKQTPPTAQEAKEKEYWKNISDSSSVLAVTGGVTGFSAFAIYTASFMEDKEDKSNKNKATKENIEK